MRAWAYLLGGLIVWAVHFFLVYVVSIIFLEADTTRIVTGLATAAALLAEGAFALFGLAGRVSAGERTDRWHHTLAALSGGLGFVAIAWQGLPALLI